MARERVTRLPSFRLDGAHALVTGAGRGIGRACALGLAEAGATVTVVSRTGAELEELAADVESLASRAFPFAADVRVREEVERAVEAAKGHGDLSILVNSAGLNRPGPTLDVADADYDLMMDTNVKGTFFACRAVGRHLLERGRGGRIVNISSQLGTVGYPGRATYTATKHAVDGMTKALAVEWAPHGITVNAVGPTFILTPMTAPFFESQAFREDVLRRIPMQRIGELEEVAAAVVFLASPAASLVTGINLLTDGGWNAW